MSSASPASVVLDDVRRTNTFDALRLIAALAVVVGHAHILGGYPGEIPALFGIPVHVLGVAVFFVISGWLITGSWERSRSVPEYVTSRALRIAPLLWAVVLLSTFVLGPVMTTLPTGEYLAHPETWHYLRNLVLLPADGLPGVFAEVPYPGVVNGSVWTLRAEVICYGVVLALGLLPRRVQTPGYLAFGVLSLGLVEVGTVTVAGSSLSAAAGTWVFFAAAALARLHLPRRALRLDVAAAVALSWGLVAVTAGPQWSERVAWVALPYVVLAVGTASVPVLRRAARFGDLSYGMYLFAFPVQQVLVQQLPPLPFVVDAALVALVCAPLAALSWHLLEKPALDLRRRLPWTSARVRV